MIAILIIDKMVIDFNTVWGLFHSYLFFYCYGFNDLAEAEK